VLGWTTAASWGLPILAANVYWQCTVGYIARRIAAEQNPLPPMQPWP
jgi:hypothetical protein